MIRLRFTRKAERDLEAIGDFIARDNPARAATFISEMIGKCRQLVDYPDAGPLRPEFGPDVRMIPFGRYLIFYAVEADLLEIIRVIHSARNWMDDKR